MLFERESGILLHPTSLPGPYGVGDLGPEAYRFVDILAEAGQGLWQVLPITPPGNAASPYQCTSSFAGDLALLSLDALERRGLLRPLEDEARRRAEVPFGPYDFETVRARKTPLLRHAAAQVLLTDDLALRGRFDAFRDRNAYWLRDYARFEALRREFRQQPWFAWPLDVRRREPGALKALDERLRSTIEVEQALQFLVEEQWNDLHTYARSKQIRIIGDLPIFVAHDSADVWSNQELFQLDREGQPTVVAGVPPDYFSKSGQRWGNPLFDWSRHEAEDFAWWRARVRRTLEMTDVLRIDHFRGFAACWEIQASEPTAINGRWVSSPGKQLFEAFQKDLGRELPIIAEDLGIITDDVVELRDHFHLPTMRILQFSFNGEEKLLPRNYPENCVAFTGTHDNDTTVGWYSSPPSDEGLMTVGQLEAERDFVRRYYSTDGTDIHWTCMKALLKERPRAVLFPMQDLLGLGSEARMNTPGTVGAHNWTWRFQWNQLSPAMIEGLEHITKAAGRRPHGES